MKYPRPRDLLVVTALALLLAPVVGSGASGASTTPSVKVPAGTTLRVADQLEGLETDLQLSGEAKTPYTVQYSALLGAPAIFEAMQAGDADLSVVGDAGIIPPQEAGDSFEVVATDHTDGGGYQLEVAPGSDITSLKQLKGQKIAYTAGTLTQSFVYQLLHDEGLKPSQVTLVNLPPSSVTAAVQAGDVDAAVTENPLVVEYKQQYPGAKLIPIPHVYSGLGFIVATKAAIDNPATSAAIADYLERLVKATNWVNTHQKAYITYYYGTYLKLPASVIPSLVASAKPTNYVPVSPAVIKVQQATTDLFTAAGALPGHLDVSKVFTTKYNKYVEAANK